MKTCLIETTSAIRKMKKYWALPVKIRLTLLLYIFDGKIAELKIGLQNKNIFVENQQIRWLLITKLLTIFYYIFLLIDSFGIMQGHNSICMENHHYIIYDHRIIIKSIRRSQVGIRTKKLCERGIKTIFHISVWQIGF